MTHSDKQKETSKRPHLRIVPSSSTEEAANQPADPSSSSASTTSSTSIEDTSEPQVTSKRTKAERAEFLTELQEYLDMILDAAHKDQIHGIAFITINGDYSTTGTAYTQSCAYDSHLTIAGIETLRYRFMRNLLEDH